MVVLGRRASTRNSLTSQLATHHSSILLLASGLLLLASRFSLWRCFSMAKQPFRGPNRIPHCIRLALIESSTHKPREGRGHRGPSIDKCPVCFQSREQRATRLARLATEGDGIVVLGGARVKLPFRLYNTAGYRAEGQKLKHKA